MDQNDLQSMREVANDDLSQAPLEEEPSALDRLIMAITSPREAFEGLLSSNRLGAIIRWGFFIAILVGLFGSLVVFSNPELIQKQMEERRAQLEQKHDAGKISDEQYEAASKAFDSSMPSRGVFTGIAIVTTIIFVPVVILLIGVLVYIISRVLQTGQDPRLRYSTALAALMTATFISSLDALAKFVGIYLTKDLKFTPDLSILAPTTNSIAKMALGLTDPFTIWWSIVLAFGISAISKSTWGKSFVAWIISWAIIMIAIGGVQQAFSGFGM